MHLPTTAGQAATETAAMSTTASVVAALLITLALAALHLAAPRIRTLPLVPEAAMGSFAGGLAVAYVFLHLLVELAEGNEAIGEALGDVVEPTPLLDLAVFAVALAGFTTYYGLQRLVRRHGSGRGDEGTDPGEPGPGVYRLHLAAFVVYNGLITYTMALRLRTGIAFAVLFAVAMGLHFILTDRTFEEHHPRRFRARGRYVLAGALLLGWGLGAVLAPTSTLVVSLLTAFLGGSILWNVFKEEVPTDRRASFAWFLTGLLLYTGLLAVVTVLAG